MPPSQQNQYEFILNPNNNHRSGGFGPSSKLGRTLVVVGGVILLIIAGLVVKSLLSSGDTSQQQRLVSVAKAEAALVQISSEAAQKAKSSDTRNRAQTIQLSVESSQAQTKQLLEKRGLKGKAYAKQVGNGKNSKTEKALQDATRNNRYDEVYNSLADQQLADYQKLIKAAHSAGTTKEKKILSASFDNATLLLPAQASNQTNQ